MRTIMRNRVILFGFLVIVAVVVGYSVWAYTNHLNYMSKTTHETERWAVIRDSKGDIIAVETTNYEVWNTLVSLHHNQTEMWIGGVVEEYRNKWEFRFKPHTIIIARITIEGAQSNIQGISGELDYWMNVWAKEAYVLAKVVEIHE